MSRYRLRIVLLSLGVLFGYGSAIARYSRGTGDHGFFCHHGFFARAPEGAPRPETGSAAPRGQGMPKPVQ
jgi:hypothetical protein